MDPLVDAAQPPMKNSENKSALENTGQFVGFPMVYPDVVAMEATWKNEWRNDSKREG